MNVSQGAFRLWVWFAVLWVGLVGLIWQSTIQQSFEHGCWFQTAQVEPPAKPILAPGHLEGLGLENRNRRTFASINIPR